MKKRPRATPPTTLETRLQCRAIMVALIVERVSPDGEVLEEVLTPAQKVLRPYWATLPETIRQILQQLNTARQPQKGGT